MTTLNTGFPETTSQYLKGAQFQDNEVCLTYKGWMKKANEGNAKTGKTWKDTLDFCLRYSYPEFAKDKAGEPLLDSKGEPMKNRYWDPAFPHGYQIVYVFNEGQYESGSKPLFELFCLVKPKVGEKLLIKRTGKDKETKWFMTRAADRFHKEEVPAIDVDKDLQPDDENLPF